MFDHLDSIPEDIFDNIKVMSTCPVCNAKYYSTYAKILEERDNGHLVHIQCKKCRSSVVALILASSMGISSISLVTDLTSEDVMKFKDLRPIQVDDVIELHNVLKNNTLDFNQP